jgi:hypothetical protein
MTSKKKLILSAPLSEILERSLMGSPWVNLITTLVIVTREARTLNWTVLEFSIGINSFPKVQGYYCQEFEK